MIRHAAPGRPRHAGEMRPADSALIGDLMVWLAAVRQLNKDSADFVLADKTAEEIHAHIAGQLGRAHWLIVDARMLLTIATDGEIDAAGEYQARHAAAEPVT